MEQDMVDFFESWVAREEQLAAELAAAPEQMLAPLVAAALEHVRAYYAHKARLADSDVVSALDPRWLGPLERTFLWAWGWKPALAFRFVGAAAPGRGMTGAQLAAVEVMRRATAAEERAIEREVAAVQESLAGPRVLAALLRQRRPPRDGETDDAVASVGRSLRALLAAADGLRERTVSGIVGLLSPPQAAAFLAALLQFHLSVRHAGRPWSCGAGDRRRE